MSRRRPEHAPSRPTWRCRACGIAWPCSPAKLRLLGEYREARTDLLIYLAVCAAEAAEQLAGHHGDVPPAALYDRFVGWARPRG
ncbi:flavin reductase [Micromonospora sp. NPDC050495]|uniref:flavin reductase n=1 Tax=Micromonospora sp. NPDC050495 TaxID=3154936 RepID=UPI0033F8BDB4